MEPRYLNISIPHDWHWSDQELYEFCQVNRDLRIERDASGKIIIMAPSGGNTSHHNAGIVTRLFVWNEKTQLGKVFDSNGGFILPSGAMRAPDAAFVLQERWDALTEAEKEGFPPLCPDFVVELRSPSDRLPVLQEKMVEWIENGCRMAWLIDPAEEQAFIYYADGQTESITTFDQSLPGGNVLPGFELNLSQLKNS